MQGSCKPPKTQQLDSIRGGSLPVWGADLSDCQRHSIRVPEPPEPRRGTQPGGTQPAGVRVWAPELQKHRLRFVRHHEADLSDGLFQVGRALQAGDQPDICGAVLLQLHLHHVKVLLKQIVCLPQHILCRGHLLQGQKARQQRRQKIRSFRPTFPITQSESQ